MDSSDTMTRDKLRDEGEHGIYLIGPGVVSAQLMFSAFFESGKNVGGRFRR